MTAGPSDNAAREARASLAAAREPRAATPGPDADALRRAYLDLLKLALCDLAGTTTQSVGALPERTVMSRELRGDERRLRAAGMDWPLHGLTMVGLARLDDLQACVESIVADRVEGDIIEAGAWRGGAAMLIRATLDTLGDDRSVVVADSFQGFPAGEPSGGELDAFDFLSVPVEEVRDSFARLGLERGVELLPGFFEETLGGLAGRRWALVRLDADTYEPTREALQRLYPGLAVGGYLVVDDYGSFEGCRRAVDEFRSDHGITEPLERIDFTGVRWRRTSTASVEIPATPAADAPRPRTVERAGVAHVPSAQELELRREVEELRRRLQAVDAGGLRTRLRRRLCGRAAR
jgi:O-methyltransferase